MDDRYFTEHRGPALGNPSRGFPVNVFLNPRGIRAGWRLLMFVCIAAGLWIPCIFGLSAFLKPQRDVFSPAAQFFAELSSFLAAFVAAWIMSVIEQRPIGVYGISRQGLFGKLFWQGSVFGICEISLLMGLMAAFGGYSFGSLAEHGKDIAVWATFFAAFFLAVAFFEEFFFRGYALYTMADGIGFWPAAVVLALCFAAVHLKNPGENWIGIAGVFFVGLFWSFTLKRTETLWFAVGMHAAFDFGETFLFSVPDSGMVFPSQLSNATLHGPNWLTGGKPGPEASLFDFLVIALFFVVFHFLHPAKPKPAPEVSREAPPISTPSAHDL